MIALARPTGGYDDSQSWTTRARPVSPSLGQPWDETALERVWVEVRPLPAAEGPLKCRQLELPAGGQ